MQLYFLFIKCLTKNFRKESCGGVYKIFQNSQENICEICSECELSVSRFEICSKLTIKAPKRRYWRRSGLFIVNFKHVSHLVLVFLMLILNI